MMDRPTIGTCWLDGCSGCHMSLLDIDEGVVAILRKADIVFGPLVDAQEWPDGVPPLLKHAVPLHEVVKVDVHVPGCPPKPNAILMVLSELLDGRKPDLGSKLRFG
jgi:coenzyme F420-reducing hydrogenase gamma subunit